MPRPPKPFLHRGWYVTDLGGTRHRLCRAEAGRKAAEEALLDLLQERRQFGGRRYEPLTVQELAALYLDALKATATKNHYNQARFALGLFCEQHGHRSTRDITPFVAESYRNALATRKWKPKYGRPKSYKPRTVNHYMAALSACWTWGDEKELIQARNPFQRVKPLETDDGRQRIMTEAEFQALLRASRPAMFRQLLLVLRYTGARPGEVRLLAWSQIDWTRHQFVLKHHKTSKKTKAPRLIAFPPLIERLLRWRKKHAEPTVPWVFPSCHGTPYTGGWAVKALFEARQRAGLETDENGENLVLYTNRHTFITTGAANAEVSQSVLQKLAGHTNPTMTAKYTHLARLGSEDLYKANVKIADALRPRRPQKEGPAVEPPPAQ